MRKCKIYYVFCFLLPLLFFTYIILRLVIINAATFHPLLSFYVNIAGTVLIKNKREIREWLCLAKMIERKIISPWALLNELCIMKNKQRRTNIEQTARERKQKLKHNGDEQRKHEERTRFKTSKVDERKWRWNKRNTTKAEKGRRKQCIEERSKNEK